MAILRPLLAPQILPARTLLPVAAVGLMALAGCQGGGTASAGAHPDADSIAEAPQPPIEAGTYVAAGDLAMSRNQAALAADQYEHALAADPKQPAIAKKLALAYMHAGKTEQGINAFKRYVELADGSSDAYGSLGYAYELAGNLAEAEKTYQEGIQRQPDGSLVRINYGLMLVRQNKIDKAVEQLQTVLQPHEVNYNIASVYEQMGRRDLAQFYYRRSLECNPGFAPAKQKLLVAAQ